MLRLCAQIVVIPRSAPTTSLTPQQTATVGEITSTPAEAGRFAENGVCAGIDWLRVSKP
jgi:hypothetical protein